MSDSSVGKFDRVGGDRNRVLLDVIAGRDNEQTIGLGIVQGGAKLPAVVDDADELQAQRRRSPRHECIARPRGRFWGRGWIPEANDEGTLIEAVVRILDRRGRRRVKIDEELTLLGLLQRPPGPPHAQRDERRAQEPCEAC